MGLLPQPFHALAAVPCQGGRWSYPSIVPTDENRKRIDEWIALAPDTRVVETTQGFERWTTQAIEDGEVRYEETEFGTAQPELNLLAGWCARQATRVDPRPPVKTIAPVIDLLERKRQG